MNCSSVPSVSAADLGKTVYRSSCTIPNKSPSLHSTSVSKVVDAIFLSSECLPVRNQYVIILNRERINAPEESIYSVHRHRPLVDACRASRLDDSKHRAQRGSVKKNEVEVHRYSDHLLTSITRHFH